MAQPAAERVTGAVVVEPFQAGGGRDEHPLGDVFGVGGIDPGAGAPEQDQRPIELHQPSPGGCVIGPGALQQAQRRLLARTIHWATCLACRPSWSGPATVLHAAVLRIDVTPGALGYPRPQCAPGHQNSRAVLTKYLSCLARGERPDAWVGL